MSFHVFSSPILPITNSARRFKVTQLFCFWELDKILPDSGFSSKTLFLFLESIKNIYFSSRNLGLLLSSVELSGTLFFKVNNEKKIVNSHRRAKILVNFYRWAKILVNFKKILTTFWAIGTFLVPKSKGKYKGNEQTPQNFRLRRAKGSPQQFNYIFLV